MSRRFVKYKTIKHYHDPGDLHELTFSCYRRIQLLTNNAWRTGLSRAIDDACAACEFDLIAFVFMPEPVHLLVYPRTSDPAVSSFLARVKRPVSSQVKADLQATQSPLLKRLIVRERPGKWTFRMWQEGPGYDRNLRDCAAVRASIAYLHDNPVKRQLCHQPDQWRWSSARHFHSDGTTHDAALPKISPLPAEYWDGDD